MSDLISRQAAIEAIMNHYRVGDKSQNEEMNWCAEMLSGLPTAEPTLYGYKIEHLAYIATVMEKEGVTAEYAVRTFDDISRILRMLIDEVREMLEKNLAEGGARMEN